MAIQSHPVKSGESLSKIAQRYNTNVSELLRLNPKLTTDPKYKNGSVIFSGTIIKYDDKITPPQVKPYAEANELPIIEPLPSYDSPITDARIADIKDSMGFLPPVQQVIPPAIVDERTKLFDRGMIPQYYEYYNGVLYNSGTPFTGLYQGVQYVNGTDSRYIAVPTLDTQTPTPIPEATPSQTLPSFDEIGQVGTIVAANQTPALDGSKLVGVSTAAPAPVSIDPSFLLDYANQLIKANTLRGRGEATKNLTIAKSASTKEYNVAQADKDLYNAKLKALASLANRGLYGNTGLKVAAQQAAGYEPLQKRSQALNLYAEQENLAKRLFEQELLEAKDIEDQAGIAKTKAEELASRLTKVGV